MYTYPNIDPVAIDLGVIQIYWYGISYVVGIAIAWYLLRYRASKGTTIISEDDFVDDLIFYGTLGIIIGGRLGSVFFYNFSYYWEHPLQILDIQQGGMSFHGGLIGVLLMMAWLSWRRSVNFMHLIDFIAPVVPIGLGCGRIGNFINGELWGRGSDLPWAMIFPDPKAGGIARHPSQLYEALLEGLLLFIILWLYSSKPRPMMSISGLFLLGYGIFRCAIEFFREPDIHLGYLAFGWLTMGQILSLPMIIFGIVLITCAYARKKKTD